MIDGRLLCAANMVSKNGVVCDVGTDHAYLAAYLIEKGIAKSCIACDIADGPLEAARKTVHEKGLDERITVVKSDGLDEIPFCNIPIETITDVVICGMGGELISDIIIRAEWLKNGVNIVAQPMTRANQFRGWLYENGFEIKSEKACEADRFVYTVMSVMYTGVKIALDDYSKNVGKLDFSDEVTKKYLTEKIGRIRMAAEGMRRSNDKAKEGGRLSRLADEIESDLKNGGKCKCCK